LKLALVRAKFVGRLGQRSSCGEKHEGPVAAGKGSKLRDSTLVQAIGWQQQKSHDSFHARPSHIGLQNQNTAVSNISFTMAHNLSSHTFHLPPPAPPVVCSDANHRTRCFSGAVAIFLRLIDDWVSLPQILQMLIW